MRDKLKISFISFIMPILNTHAAISFIKMITHSGYIILITEHLAYTYKKQF